MPKEEKQTKKVKEAKEEPEVETKEQASSKRKKVKPKLEKATKELLEKRQERSDKQPDFKRGEWFRYKRLGTNWRRPRAVTNKMRKNLKYRTPKVRIGFGKPSGVRGYHPSGFVEVLVHTANELEAIDPKLQAARIGSTVGTRKRREIIEAADAKGIRVLNRGVL
ncbi:MAG: 50S ribosomal protein L32e [Thermoplasmatota archaeon]